MSVQLSPDTDRKSPQIGKRLSVPATQNLLSGFLVLLLNDSPCMGKGSIAEGDHRRVTMIRIKLGNDAVVSLS